MSKQALRNAVGRTWPCVAAIVVVALAILISAEIAFLNMMMQRLMGLGHTMRCVVAVLALAPLALVMGMPFPTGLRIVQQLDGSMRPWAWGVNACATVIGSMLCVLLSIHAGFSVVLVAAAAIYAIGALAISLSANRAT